MADDGPDPAGPDAPPELRFRSVSGHGCVATITAVVGIAGIGTAPVLLLALLGADLRTGPAGIVAAVLLLPAVCVGVPVMARGLQGRLVLTRSRSPTAARSCCRWTGTGRATCATCA